jgi:hypothetical protein
MTLLLASIMYFITRIFNFAQLREHKDRASKSSYFWNDVSLQIQYENMELLHIVTIAHSFTCIIISGVIWTMLTTSAAIAIDRRQYYLMLFMTCSVATLYFFSIVFVVYRSTISKASDFGVIAALESLLDVIASLSNDVFSFVFALLMNFILLFGIYIMNVLSLYMAELAKSIEQRRTGGRETNELELNSFKMKGEKIPVARMPDHM